MRSLPAAAFALAALVGGAVQPGAASAPASPPAAAAAVQALAHRYYDFAWDAQPVAETDALALHRHDDRLADFSPQADAEYGRRLKGFRAELAALAPGGSTVHDRIDYLLLRADLEGDWWARTYLKAPARNPAIYENECSGGIFSLVKKAFASSAVRAAAATARLHACRRVLAQGRANLTEPVREFALVASEDIRDGDSLYTQSVNALAASITPPQRRALFAARDDALAALHDYRAWIAAHLTSWHAGGFAVGKEQYDWYLRRVLLLPWSSDRLLQIAADELARDRALEAWENAQQKYGAPPPKPRTFTGKAAFLRYYEAQTARVRAFVVSRHLLTVPSYLGAFRIVELPKALAAINPGGFMNPPGMFDKDPSGFYFVPDYDPKNTSFFAAQARRAVLPVLAHEGVPGHFMQFSEAYHHSDFIRRAHGDGVFAEGWAFYGEEMLMRAGLYDNDAAAREAVIHLMRHRATRVGVDIGLATGTMTLSQAIRYFSQTAGVDRVTAYGEGIRFAMGPGQAIDYLIGKTQIEVLLGLVRDRDGAAFSLGNFHDRLLSYGTVPLSTIRWEWLGDTAWIDAVAEPLQPVEMP